ncbi:hypothetical protein ASE37_18985 [Rhizobium sp. Root268]|nr:hypothetical protein ASE37_18985 [Rhizobium sp. Root268]
MLARVEALEGKGQTVNVTVTQSEGDERVQELVRQGVKQAMREAEMTVDRAPRRHGFGSYIVWLDKYDSQRS